MKFEARSFVFDFINPRLVGGIFFVIKIASRKDARPVPRVFAPLREYFLTS